MLVGVKWSPIGRTFDSGVTSIQIFEVERNGFVLWHPRPNGSLSLEEIFISDSDSIEEEASSKQSQYKSGISPGADQVGKRGNDARAGESTYNES